MCINRKVTCQDDNRTLNKYTSKGKSLKYTKEEKILERELDIARDFTLGSAIDRQVDKKVEWGWRIFEQQ